MMQLRKVSIDLGERLISDSCYLIETDASMDNIREAMNFVYRFYKKGIRENVRLSDPRLFKLFKLERLLSDKYFPLNNEPIFDFNDVVQFSAVIDSEEQCYEALKNFVHETRMYLSKDLDLKTNHQKLDVLVV